MSEKFKSQQELFEIVENLKKRNKRVVTVNGSFDILHTGHIKSFEEAKGLGDALIVLLNSDKSVKSYKGPGRPINSQKKRVESLTAIKDIDFITIFDEINPIKILEKIRPDFYCQGKDWGENCVEREAVEKYGGKIHVLQWQEGFSSTDLIEKDSDIQSKSDVRAIFLDRDGTININEPEYVYKIEDFKFIPNVIEALKKLSETDYKLIIITNQSGIGRGYYKLEDMEKLHKWMLEELQKQGIKIDKIYYCPHKSEDNCECRKPKIGMLLQVVKDFGISLNKSWLIGDDEKDIIMARRANLKSVKLGEKMPEDLKLEPNYYAENLSEAVKIILS